MENCKTLEELGFIKEELEEYILYYTEHGDNKDKDELIIFNLNDKQVHLIHISYTKELKYAIDKKAKELGWK